MPSELITALIGVCGSVAGALVTFPLLSYRVTQLEKKVDKHNNIIERVFRLEEDSKYVHREMEELKHERKGLQVD